MLASGGTIGVFPEGTSYTEPRIVQIKEGAAWAAVNYVQWKNKETAGQNTVGILHGEGQKTNILIVPVGIAYTDKSRYLSRVRSFSYFTDSRLNLQL
jgi:glycerol-3-phosphate O-acyltransferase / dihydroxyacetone phosphate acyltransferase